MKGVYHELEVKGGMYTGYIVFEDASFDHAFGTKKQGALVVTDFNVFSFLDDMDHNVTVAISGKFLAIYKQRLIEDAQRKGLLDDLQEMSA